MAIRCEMNTRITKIIMNTRFKPANSTFDRRPVGALLAWRVFTKSAKAAVESRSPIFSDEDEDFRNVKWTEKNHGYFFKAITIRTGQREYVYAHRIVMERIVGRRLFKGEVCDHINGIRLDNRRENLRLTDYVGNAQNSSKYGENRGASWCNNTKKWRSRVSFMGISYELGCYDNRQEAAMVAKEKRESLGFMSGNESIKKYDNCHGPYIPRANIYASEMAKRPDNVPLHLK